MNSRETWALMEFECRRISDSFGAQIHAFVLMPNHFHMILTVPNEDLGIVMMHFIRTITRTINTISGRWGRVFGARYHGSLIDSEYYIHNVFKYVYRNPVRAGLCERVEDYEFSTLMQSTQKNMGNFPIVNSPFLPPDFYKDFSHLNEPFTKELQVALQKGLRRTRFQVATKKEKLVDQKTRFPWLPKNRFAESESWN